MVTVVVIINTLISLALLYVAWKVWRLKQWLAKLADKLIAAELSTYTVLHRAPKAIYRGQQNIHDLRRRNQLLELQIKQARQIFSLLAMGQQFWLRYSRMLK